MIRLIESLSPIRPLGWAPAGLKYRSSKTCHDGSDTARSMSICSMWRFVWPYGLSGPIAELSVTGRSDGSP
jgi:hypothetical protein